MNNKQAKRLRKQVKQEANVGKLEAEYNIKRHTVLVDGGYNESGTKKLIECNTDVATLKPECTRSKYQQLKKQFKEQ